jgi:hypothetical protein
MGFQSLWVRIRAPNAAWYNEGLDGCNSMVLLAAYHFSILDVDDTSVK